MHDSPLAQPHPQRIGVFDSGVGGLSVLRHIRELFPAATLDYVADCAHMPYGNKPAHFVEARVNTIADVLIARGADALVVACNTATAAAVHLLRARCGLPVVGLEPGVKPAVTISRSKVVGVLATEGTLRSEKYARLLAQHRGDANVIGRACHGWAELVEREPLDGPQVRAAVRNEVMPLLEAGADVLVLGCTHYPFLSPVIAEIAGPEVQLIDTGLPVARQLHRLLPAQNSHREGAAYFIVSGALPPARAAIQRLWGRNTQLTALKH